jgi:hypothetical protein
VSFRLVFQGCYISLFKQDIVLGLCCFVQWCCVCLCTILCPCLAVLLHVVVFVCSSNNVCECVVVLFNVVVIVCLSMLC